MPTMTSTSVDLQQPALSPKPTKYRAPVAPPVDRTHTADGRDCETSALHQVGIMKYRAPGPPTPPSSPSAGDVTVQAPVASSNMRREPMQVLRTNNYNNNDITKSSYKSPISRTDDVLESPTSSAAGCQDNKGRTENVVSTNDVTNTTVDDDDIRLRLKAALSAEAKIAGDSTTSSVIDQLPLEKPVIQDVKLISRSSNVQLLQKPLPQQSVRSWRSSESVDKLNVLLADVTADRNVANRHLPQRQTSTSSTSSSGAPRSSFAEPNGSSSTSGRRSVYIDLGEYQTLLKHGQDDAVYSLPQPQCYGDETLRAVRLITEKYDTFKRRQLRAQSFREGLVRPNYQQVNDGVDRPDTIIEGIPTGGAPATTDVNDASVTSSNEPSAGHLATGVMTDELTTAASDAHCDSTAAVSSPPPDITACCPLSTTSRTVISLSRYRIDLSGHVAMSSVDDVTLLPYDPEMTSSCEDGGVSRTDRLRVEMFYRSRETTVYVCASLADLFVGASPTTTMSTEAGSVPTAHCWVHLHTGVPVWLLNTGRDSLRRRELILVLADRQTGLPLWRDRINYLSNYSAIAATQDADGDDRVTALHCLRMSGSLSKVVRLAMFDRRAADAFFAKFRELTSDPNDDLWKISEVPSGGGNRKSKNSAVDRSSSLLCSMRRSARRRSVSHVTKSSISLPCSVVHVCRIDPRHPNFRAAFSHLLLPPASATGIAANDAITQQTTPPSSPSAVANGTSLRGDGIRSSCVENGVENDDMEEYRPRLPTR